MIQFEQKTCTFNGVSAYVQDNLILFDLKQLVCGIT